MTMLLSARGQAPGPEGGDLQVVVDEGAAEPIEASLMAMAESLDRKRWAA